MGVPVLTWPGFNNALSETENSANNRRQIKSLKEQGYKLYNLCFDSGYSSGQLNGAYLILQKTLFTQWSSTKFLDKLKKMENYFSETPYYKKWGDIISLLSKKSSFISSNTLYSFSKTVCQREDVREIFLLEDKQLEIIYGHEDRMFFCRLSNIKTGEIIRWKSSPPEITKFNNLRELEIEIDKWMDYLKLEL